VIPELLRAFKSDDGRKALPFGELPPMHEDAVAGPLISGRPTARARRWPVRLVCASGQRSS
jgi:hypothetical protein